MSGVGQPDLFPSSLEARASDTAPRAARVGPAAAGAEWQGLAQCLPPTLRFGTSTWSFPGWEGIVYDRGCRESELARHGLAAYARHPLLRAVGIDRSFYAPVPRAELERQAAATGADFRFLMKDHAALTTPRSARRPAFLAGVPEAFLDVDHALRHVVEPAVTALGERLGVLLFQFSPLGRRVLDYRLPLLERLHGFLRALPRGPTYAVEWRDPEMLGADYHAMLADVGAVHGLCAHPRMPPLTMQESARPGPCPLVIRWLLGQGRSYDEARAAFAPFDRLAEPDVAARAAIGGLVRVATEAGRQALVIVNNKAEGSAPLSIFELARSIAGPAAAAC